MATVLRLFADHPLIGSWVLPDEDRSAIQFDIAPALRGFRVEAHDTHDGERYVVTDIHWDGTALCFNLLVPSNGTTVRHRMRSVRGGKQVEDRFTATYRDTFVRK